jgi:hypothetical protein
MLREMGQKETFQQRLGGNLLVDLYRLIHKSRMFQEA